MDVTMMPYIADAAPPAGAARPARDQRHTRVGAEAESVRDAGADREHVLGRAADFDTDDIGRGIRAEVLPREAPRQGQRIVVVTRGHRHGRPGAKTTSPGWNHAGKRFGQMRRKTHQAAAGDDCFSHPPDIKMLQIAKTSVQYFE